MWSVAGFGAAIVLFGLSTNFWLSLVALYLSGVFDNYSVVVRHTLVQMLTPDVLRGRVSAFNQLFMTGLLTGAPPTAELQRTVVEDVLLPLLTGSSRQR